MSCPAAGPGLCGGSATAYAVYGKAFRYANIGGEVEDRSTNEEFVVS